MRDRSRARELPVPVKGLIRKLAGGNACVKHEITHSAVQVLVSKTHCGTAGVREPPVPMKGVLGSEVLVSRTQGGTGGAREPPVPSLLL